MNYKILLKLILICAVFLKASSCFASCTSNEINNLRADALSLYKQTDYKSAEDKLSTFYNKQCSFYVMAQASDEIFNDGLWLISDLMFYRKKLNEQLGCLSLGDDVYSSWMISDTARHDKKLKKHYKRIWPNAKLR